MKIRARVGAALTAVLLGVVGAAALASPASAAAYGPYELKHGASGFCLEAPTSNINQQLILNYCGGPASHNEHFIFDDSGTGAYQYFVRLEGTSYCLVPGNADLFGSTIVLWPCDYGSYRFVWYLGFPSEVNHAQRNLMNVYTAQAPLYSPRCIDNTNTSAGVYVKMLGCYGDGFWWLTPKS
jgi:hypothetical protein